MRFVGCILRPNGWLKKYDAQQEIWQKTKKKKQNHQDTRDTHETMTTWPHVALYAGLKKNKKNQMRKLHSFFPSTFHHPFSLLLFSPPLSRILPALFDPPSLLPFPLFPPYILCKIKGIPSWIDAWTRLYRSLSIVQNGVAEPKLNASWTSRGHEWRDAAIGGAE